MHFVLNPHAFTAAEVRQRLHSEDLSDTRTGAVHAAAARTSVWSDGAGRFDSFDLGRTAGRLPTVVFWYRQGLSCHEIGRRLSTFGGAWDAHRAIDVAAELIARALNRGDISELAA
jgi:hypothetical protein